MLDKKQLKGYDLEKPVILVCAGPTARKVSTSKIYYTAGVNTTPNLIDETDFWIVNDACYFDDISEENKEKVKNIVMPQFPHTVNGIDYKPNVSCDFKTVIGTHDDLLKRILSNKLDVFSFNIQSAARFNLPVDRSAPLFEAKSSSESALKWLVHQGFKKFISLGHDPDGGYHGDMISRPTRGGGHVIVKAPIDNARYKEVNQRLRAVVDNNECEFIRLVTPSETTIDDTLIANILNRFKPGYQEIFLEI